MSLSHVNTPEQAPLSGKTPSKIATYNRRNKVTKLKHTIIWGN